MVSTNRSVKKEGNVEFLGKGEGYVILGNKALFHQYLAEIPSAGSLYLYGFLKLFIGDEPLIDKEGSQTGRREILFFNFVVIRVL